MKVYLVTQSEYEPEVLDAYDSLQAAMAAYPRDNWDKPWSDEPWEAIADNGVYSMFIHELEVHGHPAHT